MACAAAWVGSWGIAVEALLVAALSATSLGAVLAASALAFTLLKFAGAAYLIYLGIRLWRAPPFRFGVASTREAAPGKRFLEGLSLQLTNPKAIFFFLSVLPQFIVPEQDYLGQFVALVLTCGALAVGIHGLYAAFAQRAKGWLVSPRGGRVANKAAASTFVFFGATLATASR